MVVTLQRCAIAFPNFNYLAGEVYMNVQYVDYLEDGQTYVNSQYTELRQLALLNQLNPDWKWLSESGTDQNFSLQSGDNSVMLGGKPLLSAELNLQVSRNAKIDKWYGSSSFSILGVANFGNQDGPAGPAIFINNAAQLLHPPDNFYNKLYITLKPGVRGDVLVTPIAPYPYIGLAVYPSGEPAYWTPWTLPEDLGMQEGKLYPILYPPP